MARPRARVAPVDEAVDEDARRRARFAWMQGRFGTHEHAPLIGWDWPTYDDEDGMTGVELLERVAEDYAAAGVPLPIGGYDEKRGPYLLPGERSG